MLEIGDERGGRLVDLPAAVVERLAEVVVRIAVVVPVRMVELHEANSALDHPAGEEAVARERWPVVLDAVHRPGVRRLT